jgi:hypothetical protein
MEGRELVMRTDNDRTEEKSLGSKPKRGKKQE